MTIPRKKTAGSKGTPSRKGAALFGYAVPRDRIRSLAAMGLPDDARIAVITRRPLPGSKFDRLERVALSEVVARSLAEDGLAPAAPVAPSRAGKGPSVGRATFEPDARARALLRGVEIAESDMAAAGGAYDLGQVQRLMHGVSRQRIERRVQNGTLLAVPGPSNRRRYPTIQFNPDGTVVDGLKIVQETLDFSSPWSVLSFLVNPDDRLGNERPIEVLRRGDVDLVLESARRVGVQGA
jgi:hypothetical protein